MLVVLNLLHPDVLSGGLVPACCGCAGCRFVVVNMQCGAATSSSEMILHIANLKNMGVYKSFNSLNPLLLGI